MRLARALCFGLGICCLRVAPACTEVLLPPATQQWVSMRTMDYPIPLGSEMVVEPRGESWTSTAPAGRRGSSWISSYGFVGINALGLRHYTDVLNEHGLSVATLILPETVYDSGESDHPYVEISDVATYLASQCKSVAEVRDAIARVRVWGANNPLLGETPKIHLAIHDAQGASIIVEWIDGNMNIHEDHLGVCTNAPELPAHWRNLNDYAGLSPKNAPSWLGPETNGSGMRGLPGDATSTSRFVRMAVLKRYAPEITSSAQAKQLALQWMGLVWVPRGMIHSQSSSYTQWGVVRDHNQRSYAIVSDNNRTVRSLSLADIDFSPGADRVVWDIGCGPTHVDLGQLPAKRKHTSKGATTTVSTPATSAAAPAA